MNLSVSNPQKSKRPLPRRTGYLKLLLIPILLAVACYGGMWVFARYGGEWVMDNRISLPPGIQLMKVSYRNDYQPFYTHKISLYFHSVTPEAAERVWKYLDRSYYEKRAFLPNTRVYDAYSAIFRYIYPDAIWHENCGGVGYFIYQEDLSKQYSDLRLPDNTIPFEVLTCWPNVK